MYVGLLNKYYKEVLITRLLYLRTRNETPLIKDMNKLFSVQKPMYDYTLVYNDTITKSMVTSYSELRDESTLQ